MGVNLYLGSPMLMGNNTIPGVSLHPEVKAMIPIIDRECRDFGLDYPPFVVEMQTYDEISEIAAYGGFPQRFSHWTFGMEYEGLARGYEYGQQKIFEMVVNTVPLYIYCLDSNPLVDHVNVIAHALGHGDFFKNNRFFRQTSGNMMNELASHGTRIGRYEKRWGKEVIGQHLDRLLMIDDLIEPQNAWKRRVYQEPVMVDSREYEHERRLDVREGHDYMTGFVNPDDYIQREKKRILENDVRRTLGIFDGKTKGVFEFLMANAPLQVWQRDIMSMILDESYYFYPQGQTKTINEGWASYVDFNIMARRGLAGCDGIIDYAKHKAAVLGGKYSQNPYKLGFTLLMDIEERWDKGRFGSEYENCTDMKKRADWDRKLGLGKEKVFEVRRDYNDYMLIAEFFDEDFCNKYEFYEWQKLQNGEYKIVGRDWKKIKAGLLRRHMNRGLPDIRLADPDHRGRKIFLLEHQWDGRTLKPDDTAEVLKAIQWLWKGPTALVTQDGAGNDMVFVCTGQEKEESLFMTREKFEKLPL